MERPFSREAILEQLGTVLSSRVFQGAERSKTLLRFLVEQTVGGQEDRLKEYTLGSEALGKGDSFDPRIDPIVRAEASRLRGRLERYYAAEGRTNSIVIELPKGSYVPQFTHRIVGAETDTTRIREERGPSPSSIWFVLGGGAIASALAFGIWASTRAMPAAERTPVRFDVELRSNGLLGSEVGNDVVLSPDGARVVFVSRGSDGLGHLNTRRLDRSAVVELPGTEGARGPFFSPDGRWVGFWASGKLKKSPLDGGSPIVLCDAADLLGGSWGGDGNIIAALSFGKLWRVPSSGGEPILVADLSGQSVAPVWPQVLPGAKAALISVMGAQGADEATIEALSLADGRRRAIVKGGTYGRYLWTGSAGYLTYVNQGTLFAMPFDVDRLEANGTTFPVLDDVAYASTFGYAQLDFSAAGTLVYQRQAAGGLLSLEWLDESGKTEPLVLKPGRYIGPRLSPDGRRIAASVVESGVSSLFVYEPHLKRTTRLMAPRYGAPAWTPDGRALVLGGLGGLAWMPADNSRAPEQLTHAGGPQIPWSFTPDGSRLAYHAMGPSATFDLWTIPLRRVGDRLTAGTPEPFLQTASFETYPTFSPDGRWLAYGSNESGAWEVYVRAFPDNGTKVQVSNHGGRIPAWSRNGRELLYRTDENRIMAASYQVAGNSFVAAKPRLWSVRQLADTGVAPNFDLAPDGRVVALLSAATPEEQQTRDHVTFILNFFDEVRRREALIQK